MIEKLLAGLALAACVLLLIRMRLSPPRRHSLDASAIAYWRLLRGAVLWLWRSPSARRRAREAAQQAIRRASEAADRDGNVYRPKSFKRPRKPH